MLCLKIAANLYPLKLRRSPPLISISEKFIPSVPKLETAAFIAPKRERSTSWTVDELWEESEVLPEPAVEDAPAADKGTIGIRRSVPEPRSLGFRLEVNDKKDAQAVATGQKRLSNQKRTNLKGR